MGLTPYHKFRNPNVPRWIRSIHSQNPMSSEGYASSGSDNETFQQFRANHPGMTYAEALRAWKAKKRGKHLSDPNTMNSGGPHL